MKIKPDFLYSYFLCPTSVVASRLGKKYNISSFMEHGEGLYLGNEKYGNSKLKKEFKNLTGVIAVSNQNRNYMINSEIVSQDKVIVYPNCYREERFYNINKKEARKHFGFDPDIFIVGYAGSLDDNKGINRIEEAVNKMQDVFLLVLVLAN